MSLSRLFLLAAMAAPALLAGCATQPPAGDLASAPVVRFGQPVPADKNYVLLYPAGAPLPVVASVTGSLLSQDVQAQLTPSVNRDVYMYRQWVSFDGKSWTKGPNAITGAFHMTLPGAETGQEPGTLSGRFDLK